MDLSESCSLYLHLLHDNYLIKVDVIMRLIRIVILLDDLIFVFSFSFHLLVNSSAFHRAQKPARTRKPGHHSTAVRTFEKIAIKVTHG